VHAHKRQVSIPTDQSHELSAVLDELLSFPMTPEEEKVLDDFEAFRREHPIRLSTSVEES
jgi:hypothetical protein